MTHEIYEAAGGSLARGKKKGGDNLPFISYKGHKNSVLLETTHSQHDPPKPNRSLRDQGVSLSKCRNDYI